MAPLRSFSSNGVPHPPLLYEAVVVGSGPAGITAVGNLLENNIRPVLWVDPAFDGGRVNQYYREVPSNTKVKLFVDYALACTPFKDIVEGDPDVRGSKALQDTSSSSTKPDKLQAMRTLDQESGCQLSHAADACLILTEGLRRTPGVEAVQGTVAAATLVDENAKAPLWTLNIHQEHPQLSSQTQTKRLVLCTGSRPVSHVLPNRPPGLRNLDLDVVLSPTRLDAALSQIDGPITVAVVGASHSAILVLMNLAQLALSSHPDLHIKWFTRHPLRYAEYEDGFIARDNTGLKGQAAVWAKENLEPDTLPCSPIHRFLHKIAYEKGGESAVYKDHLQDCNFVVQAVGYQRNPIPHLSNSNSKSPIDPVFNHNSGSFHFAADNNCPVPGLFGLGIAFPERVIDRKYGHPEFNVGFMKFMKAAKKWVPAWK